MAGHDAAHDDLLGFFPGASSAECNGDGIWATVTNDGSRESVRCPVCTQAKMGAAIAAFVPPRFRQVIAVPGAVAGWAQRGTGAQGLYLAGPVGTGKTHTAWAALTAWCMATGITPSPGGDSPSDGHYGPSAVFTRLTDLLDDLRPGDDARQRVRDCQNCRLLVIDDIGAEKASEWTQERLYSVIDHRYANCLPLIVTSNLPPGGLPGKPGDAPRNPLADQIGPRTESRLAEMCEVVPMTGADRRKGGAA